MKTTQTLKSVWIHVQIFRLFIIHNQIYLISIDLFMICMMQHTQRHMTWGLYCQVLFLLIGSSGTRAINPLAKGKS